MPRFRSSPRRLVVACFLSLGLATSSLAQDPAVEAPAYQIAEGSIIRNRVVALGQDLWLDGEATSQVVVLNGDARIRGKIAGDLIVLGGHASLGEKASIGGDLYVLGGRVDLAPGAQVDGRSVA